MKTGHPCLAHDLGLILVLHVPALHGTAATGATLWQRNLYFLIHDRGNRAMALTAVADSGLSTGASRIGLRLALGERCSLTLRRPSREIEFVLQPVALLPKFLFFLLDEFLFMPKLFVLSTQLLMKRNSSRRSEEHTSELQSLTNLVCRLLLEKKKK